jgi:choline dehydrogenase-like flavoprotein
MRGWRNGDGNVFDYVIVGAGSAGCVLAARLSEDAGASVCLIEAGPSDLKASTRWKARVPAGSAAFRHDTRCNWLFAYEPDKRLGNRPIPCPRGRILGGSSTINGMIYIRGHRRDYDDWAALGNTGWSFDEVLPWFRKSENFAGRPDAQHGVGGELAVTKMRDYHPLSRALVDAASQCQFPVNDDFNGPEQDGFGLYDVTQKHGQRWSSSRAFLHPALTRPNLAVVSGAFCTGLRFEGRRAVAVKLKRGGQSVEIRARRDIVLSAGAIGSPHLLLASGVGPAAHLQASGVAVVHDLPGVGRNLQDHVDNVLVYADLSRTTHAATARGLVRIMGAALTYAVSRRGMFASNMVEAGGFLRTRPGLAQPDVQYHFTPLILDRSRLLPPAHGFLVHAAVLRPKSRGWLELASPDPAEAPRLHANFYSDAGNEDIQTMMRGLRIGRQIVASPALAAYRGAELAPGATVTSDADFEDFIRSEVGTTFHPVGTCKMGVDADAVVDPHLAVHGIAGLRVVDASIMPNIVSGNTNAPAIMIGERGADFIRTAAKAVARAA